VSATDERPDYGAITERLQAVWSAGDFNVIATPTMGAAEMLVGAVDPRAGDRVLDVACGSGNAALVAARRHCEVSGIDYVPALIERARLRAAAEGHAVDFRVADAQALPFPDGHFDAMLSVFGVMFAPDQERAAAELVRVCRPGGTIGIAAWMPEGYGGDFFRALAAFVPPPPGTRPGVRWGTEEGLRELFGSGIGELRTERRTVVQHYRSVGHAMEVFRAYFGPAATAFEAVEPSRAPELQAALEAVFTRYDDGVAGSCALRCEYLQALATRSG
jgi:ubiquinone/menaquinone biosynthesis C-methylase UbiE